MNDKTHYRKAFHSPYLSSADVVGQVTLTIKHVKLEPDLTKKTKDYFNTAHFVEKEIRKGEELKPMILNAGNSKIMAKMCGSAFIDDWNNVPVTIYVDSNVRFGRDTVEGLRLSPKRADAVKPELTNEDVSLWDRAIAAYRRDKSFAAIEKSYRISDENKELIKRAADVQVS